MDATFDLDGYLARIGLAGAPAVDRPGLEAIHRAQLLSVPFENIDVALGRGVDVSLDAITAKLVDGGRGGYCHESNQLLAAGLAAAGFDVELRLARVVAARPPQVPGRTHSLVEIRLGGETWIADAGFGAPGPRHPVVLDAAGTWSDPAAGGAADDRWRTVPDPEFGWRMQRRPASGGADEDLYVFDRSTVHASDIDLGNHWTSTHPASSFVRRPIVVRHTPDGRIVVVGDRLIHVRGDERESRTLEDSADLRGALAETLGARAIWTDDELGRLLDLGRAWSAAARRDAPV